MSDEEKEAIKKVKYICDKWYDENLEIDVKWLASLLSLCEKQQKEIEKWRKQYRQLEAFYLGDYVRKDKIKEILHLADEECDSEEKILSLLETIWHEFNRLEDIEDRKVQVDYERVFNKGVKSVEAKIKAKIEELKKNKDFDEDVYAEEFTVDILQSLLEEEQIR